MAGNEIEVCKFLFSNIGKIYLSHIGHVVEVAAPISSSDRYVPIQCLEDFSQISTSHSDKKADIYLNGQGVSIKQMGGSFSFNRLQRKNLFTLYTNLSLSYPETIITTMDEEVHKFHQGLLLRRNQPWQKFFVEQDFKTLMQFLMLEASPNLGSSKHPAEFILEASQPIKHQDDLTLYSFDEYFERYKQKLEISIRRQWIGQESNSEHSRALGISRNLDNAPWVFDNVAGVPLPHKITQKIWRDDFPESDRKTVYFLMIEKKK
ncbi:MAG: hypothetical protein KME11_16270 [Timaviella obliquedivisa GSE-PSE-MK23-08B]|jgi:hypothetical protein|nr:hypothetical protein [Timaviella obliquedivisa GSE-PSE-MK23-08B]